MVEPKGSFNTEENISRNGIGIITIPLKLTNLVTGTVFAKTMLKEMKENKK